LTDSATDSIVCRVGFVSLGCAKNLVDSQVMAERLLAANIKLAAPEESDIIIVNTCSFIGDAREESMEMILSACEQKRAGGCRAVLVAGCLPQRYRDRISEALPDVDAFIGLDQLEDLPEIVSRLTAGERGIVDISDASRRLFDPDGSVVFSTGANAYLKIAEGCNHRCAFCAIPGIRGRHRSRSIDKIVEEAAGLLSRGFRELDLISQDITYYGRDLKDGTNLAALLRELVQLDGDYRIRLLYSYPDEVTDELLEVMANEPRICNYLDVPIQHSHPEVLQAMLRGSTVEAVRSLAGRIRSYMPDAVIRTTCLVGFPGETDAHFEHLLQFCRETRFNNLGAFIYSPEENTPAYDMDDVPAPEVAEERYRRLMEQQRAIAEEINRGMLGKTVTVLLENRDAPDSMTGRHEGQAPEVDGITAVTGLPPDAKTGVFVKARITGFDGYDLTAEYIS